MNYDDERYVRLYVRDTADLIKIGWEGRIVLCDLMRKLDRAGVWDMGEDIDLLPELLRIDEQVFRVGFQRCLDRGIFEVNGKYILMPNFLRAQEATQTDRMRQEDSRARRRDVARAKEAGVTIRDDGSQGVTDEETVTNRDSESPDVTAGHENGQRVTRGHTVSQVVTPYRTVPSVPSTHVQAVGVVGVGGSASPAEPGAESDWRSAALDAAYEAYPRKVGRGEGHQLLMPQLKRAEDGDALAQAVRNYASEVRGREQSKIKLWPSFARVWRDYVTLDTHRPAAASTAAANRTVSNATKPPSIPEAERVNAEEARATIAQVSKHLGRTKPPTEAA